MKSRNDMKMQYFVMLVKKHLNINMLKLKNIVKSEIIVIIQGNKGVLHIVYVI